MATISISERGEGADCLFSVGESWGKWARRGQAFLYLVGAATLMALGFFYVAVTFVPPESFTIEAFGVLTLCISIALAVLARVAKERQWRRVSSIGRRARRVSLCCVHGLLVLFVGETYAVGVEAGFDSDAVQELALACLTVAVALGVYHVRRRRRAQPEEPATTTRSLLKPRRRLRRRIARRVASVPWRPCRQRATEVRLRERCAALQHRLGSLRREFNRRVAELHTTACAKTAAHRSALAEARAGAAELRNELCGLQHQLRLVKSESASRAEQCAREEIVSTSLEQLRALAEEGATPPRSAVPSIRPPPISRRTAKATVKATAKMTRTEDAGRQLTDAFEWERKPRRVSYWDDVHYRHGLPKLDTTRKVQPGTDVVAAKHSFVVSYDIRPEAGFNAWRTAQHYVDFVFKIEAISHCIARFVPSRWAPVNRNTARVANEVTAQTWAVWRYAVHLCREFQTETPIPRHGIGVSTPVLLKNELEVLRIAVQNDRDKRRHKRRFLRRIAAWLCIMEAYRIEFLDLMDRAEATQERLCLTFWNTEDVLAPPPNGVPRRVTLQIEQTQRRLAT
eukprot:TRINITY_DN10008_c0_g2_i1.p1 TRINITY_DN10008_c0_g2~~TRINITY_DN10008_c0_g2_i1.p1  ORF type:complete len:569 (+),score=46.06 TRINITY_DN10008_c0_g2_i1:140-1846(+)